MKKNNKKTKLGLLKYLLFLPLFLLAFCQSEFDEPLADAEKKPALNTKVLELMKSAIQSDSDKYQTQNKDVLSKSTATEVDDQCTYFLYPMTFEVYSGDDPVPELKEINSDEELLAFIELFTYENDIVAATTNYEMFIYFPITLLDSDGVETVLNNLTELEGTLQMAVEACESFNNDPVDGAGTGSDGGSDDGTDSGSDSDSSGGSGSSTDDGSGTDSDSGSDDGSGTGSDSGSDDSTESTSDDGSATGSEGESSTGSDGGSDGGSDDDSNSGSGDDSDSSSGDGSGTSSDGGSDDGTEEESTEGDNTDSSVDQEVVSDHDHIDNDQDDNDNGYKFCDKNNKKVYICHKGITICVSVNAIWGHLEHHEEDFLGTCED